MKNHFQNVADYHFGNFFDMEIIMIDPLLYGDYRNAMNEGEARLYEDLLDYNAIFHLFTEVTEHTLKM